MPCEPQRKAVERVDRVVGAPGRRTGKFKTPNTFRERGQHGAPLGTSDVLAHACVDPRPESEVARSSAGDVETFRGVPAIRVAIGRGVRRQRLWDRSG